MYIFVIDVYKCIVSSFAPKSSCHSSPVWVAVPFISCSISTMEGLPVPNKGKMLWKHIHSGHKLKILDNFLSPVIWKIGHMVPGGVTAGGIHADPLLLVAPRSAGRSL